MQAYAAIDWDRNKAIAVATDHTGKSRQLRKPLAPTLSAVQAFLDTIRRWNPGTDTIRIAMETGHLRWARLFTQPGVLVHLIDSKQARRFAESMCSSGAKDDRRDAFALLTMVQSPDHRRAPWTPPDARSAALLHLNRAHQQLSQQQTRTTNRLRALLNEHWPALEAAVPTLHVGWFRLLMRAFPTPKDACSLTRESYDTQMKGSGIHAATQERVWEALVQTEVLLEPLEAEMVGLTVDLLLEQLAQVRSQVQRVETKMEEVMQDSPTAVVLRSMSGVGLHLGSGLLSLCFSQPELPSRDAASIRLGASPVSRQSGKQRSIRMRRCVNGSHQQLTYLLGLQAVRRLSWAAAMYKAGRQRGQSAGTAFRRVSRSLLRILTAMVRDGVEYDDARYVQALQARGVSWAQELAVHT